MKRFQLFLAVLLVWGRVHAQPHSNPSKQKLLELSMQALANDPDLAHAGLGMCVMEIESGKILASHHSSLSLMTASTMKVLSSGAAMSILGPDHQFETRLEYDGNISPEGVLEGNLYIRGGGDPSLGSSRFEGYPDLDSLMAQWARKVAGAGIREIRGKVVGDASIFEDALTPSTWQWADMGNYYAAGANGLTLAENTYYLYFKTGPTGRPTELLRTEPDMKEITFINEITGGPAGSGDNGYVYGSPYTYLRYLRGTLPPNQSEFSIKGSIPEPALFAAQRLKESLNRQGISITAAATSFRELKLAGQDTGFDRKTIHTQKSPPLKDIVWWLNKKSVNLFAEHMVKYLGWHVKKEGSHQAGLDVIYSFWRKKGVDMDGFFMADGSGLSRNNGITALQMCQALRAMSQDPNFNPFLASLPIAGVSSDIGSLRRMCTGTPAANNLRAKSGYISRVRGYVGYVKDTRGRPLCFALLANNYSCSAGAMRQKFEKIMVSISELD